MKKQLKKTFPSNVKTCILCENAKLSTKFLVKDNKEYISHYPNVTYNETYVGGRGRRSNECITYHNK